MSCSKIKRGKVYIFNIFQIKNGAEDQRKGSEVDVENIRKTFEQMNAVVEKPFIDFTEEDIKKKMAEIKNEDFTEYDYVAIAFSSHGSENSIAITAHREFIYLRRTFMVPLNKNRTLSRKLKWLITQSCRGPYDMHIESATENQQTLEVDPRYDLISYSTSEGFLSRRCPINGSIFIQSLCEMLRTHYHDEDIISILNRVGESVRKSLQYVGIEQKPSNEDNFGEEFSFSFYNKETQ